MSPFSFSERLGPISNPVQPIVQRKKMSWELSEGEGNLQLDATKGEAFAQRVVPGLGAYSGLILHWLFDPELISSLAPS